jgi:tetratricopeptide (TPR) repeat protein
MSRSSRREASAPKSGPVLACARESRGLLLAVTASPAGDRRQDRAAQIGAASAGKANDAVALALWAKARALESQNKLDAAFDTPGKALEIDDQVIGKDNAAELDIITAMGRVELARKHPAEAVTHLERARDLREVGPHGSGSHARASRSRALEATGQHERASLAKEANTWFASSSLAHITASRSRHG